MAKFSYLSQTFLKRLLESSSFGLGKIFIYIIDVTYHCLSSTTCHVHFADALQVGFGTLSFYFLLLCYKNFYDYALMALLKFAKVPSVHTRLWTQKISILEYQANKMTAAQAEPLTSKFLLETSEIFIFGCFLVNFITLEKSFLFNDTKILLECWHYARCFCHAIMLKILLA